MATLSRRLDDLEKQGPAALSLDQPLSPETLALLAELHDIGRTPSSQELALLAELHDIGRTPSSQDGPDLDPIESARLSRELEELQERKWAEGRSWRRGQR